MQAEIAEMQWYPKKNRRKAMPTYTGRPVGNLRFADDFDVMGETKVEIQDLTSRLETV